METFAVSVFPVAQPDEWRAFIDSIASGERADAHRQMLRRLGIKREHIRYQPSPAGDVMVLVWEGVDQDSVAPLLADMLQNPQSEHERYIGHPRDPGSPRCRPIGRSAADGAESRDDRDLTPRQRLWHYGRRRPAEEHTSQDVGKFIRQADASCRRRPLPCRWGKPGGNF
jgi:hypothetical protein